MMREKKVKKKRCLENEVMMRERKVIKQLEGEKILQAGKIKQRKKR